MTIFDGLFTIPSFFLQEKQRYVSKIETLV
jgi:hypothetical protein